MELVKKNMVSIIFAVIALLAVAADFVFMSGKFKTLHDQAQARASVHTEINGLLSKPRKEPIISPNSTEAPPLSRFPVEKIIQDGNAKILVLVNGSKQAHDQAVQLNTHKPLVADALPGVPGNTYPSMAFAREYARLTDVGNINNKNTIRDQLKAGLAPTEADITLAKNTRAQEIRDTETHYDKGQPINTQQVDQMIAEAMQTIVDDLRNGVAQKSLCYVNADTFTRDQTIITSAASGQAPDFSNIWWAQVGLWVQEDICLGITELNKSAPNVTEAPVKHVLKIIVPSMINPPIAGQGGGGSPGFGFLGAAMTPGAVDPNTGAAAAGTVADPSVKNYLLNPTGRVSNGMYDVILAQVEMNVEAERLPEVLESLGKGKFLSVVQVRSVTAMDSALAKGAGYLYGAKPVVTVNLVVEDIFLRDWTSKLMPERVKTALGVQPPAAAPPAGP